MLIKSKNLIKIFFIFKKLNMDFCMKYYLYLNRKSAGKSCLSLSKKNKKYLIAPTYINYKKYHAAIIYLEPF